MKIEKAPPFNFNEDSFHLIARGAYESFLDKSDEEYFYYDDIKYRKDLPLETPEETWSLIKAHRLMKSELLTFGKYGFRYNISSFILKNLHDFDLNLVGGLHKNPISPSDKINFLNNSLFEEAVASSQVEGAATTTEVARDMLKSGRKPRNESEQMIFNNLRAIKYISECVDSPLDFKIIVELHKIMTANTDAEKYSGNFRKGEVYITDHVDGEIAHIPPNWTEVESLITELCIFINNDEKFIHPIIKASIVHFMIGFIHPFKDGNGRTARALFYWFLMKKGYTLIQHTSISRVILESRTQYDKAFLKTENDDNDLNYFIFYSLKNLRLAFEKLVNYRDKKIKEKEDARLIAYQLLERGLNKRQADLISYLFLKKNVEITLNSYSKKHDIVRQTAKRDMTQMIELGLIIEDKSTRPYKYSIKSKRYLEEYLTTPLT